MSKLITFWLGNHGDYFIPDRFNGIKFTKSGWPDKRCKLYAEFMEWVKEVDKP